MVLHDRAGREDDSARSEVACAGEIRLAEVFEPFDHFVWFGVGEEEADLAFYLLCDMADENVRYED